MGSINKTVRIPKTRVAKGENYCIKPGDILIAMSGATTGKIGVVPSNFDGLILQNQRVGNFKITDSEQIDKGYLKHFVSSPSYQNQIWNSMVGVAQPNISSKQLENFEIALPPLEDQKRIAEILDCAEELRSKRRDAIAQLDALTQAIFLEMFGNPVTNPKGWDITKVGEVADVQGGLQVSSARKKYPREVPYLRVANVYRGYLDLSEIKMIRATDTEISRTLLNIGLWTKRS
ncbi:MAG TPA: restriction endonuclease subunit S [Nodularia sp. (in: cyanobacteria)]|nr:restriction endonuclease subunit S [Nodularia sp. (in: cyanobacteria)]